jgi:hypothetical protein
MIQIQMMAAKKKLELIFPKEIPDKELQKKVRGMSFENKRQNIETLGLTKKQKPKKQEPPKQEQKKTTLKRKNPKDKDTILTQLEEMQKRLTYIKSQIRQNIDKINKNLQEVKKKPPFCWSQLGQFSFRTNQDNQDNNLLQNQTQFNLNSSPPKLNSDALFFPEAEPINLVPKSLDIGQEFNILQQSSIIDHMQNLNNQNQENNQWGSPISFNFENGGLKDRQEDENNAKDNLIFLNNNFI